MGYGVWSVDTTFTGMDGLTEFEKDLYRTWVEVETHSHFNNKTTVLVIKLKNGFEIVGTSGCEDPTKFSGDLGRQYALKRALASLGEFTAFYRAQLKHIGEQTGTLVTVSEDQGFTDKQKQDIKRALMSAMNDYNLGIFR